MQGKSKKAGQDKHAYRIVEERLTGGTLKSPLFLYGQEEYLIRFSLSRIVETYVSPAAKELDHAVMEGPAASLESIIRQCETLPILSQKRVVVAGSFAPLAGETQKGFSAEDEKRLAGYLQDLPETCFLIFTGAKADKRLRLYKSISSSGGDSFDFTKLDSEQLGKFIVKRLKQAGKTIRPSTLAQWIGFSGYYNQESDYSLYNFDNDIKKVIAYCPGEEVLFPHIEATASADALTYIFAMLDAISERRKDSAFQILHNLLTSGENEFRILSALCSQLELILTVKEMQEEGLGYREMEEALHVHQFRIQKALQHSRFFSAEQLRHVQSRAYGIEQNIKSGLLDTGLAFELFIAAI